MTIGLNALSLTALAAMVTFWRPLGRVNNLLKPARELSVRDYLVAYPVCLIVSIVLTVESTGRLFEGRLSENAPSLWFIMAVVNPAMCFGALVFKRTPNGAGSADDHG